MSAKHRRRTTSRIAVATLAGITVGIVGAGTVVMVNVFASSGTTTADAAAAPASSVSASPTLTARSSRASASPVAVPLHVVSITPDHASPISGTTPVVVTFDAPIATESLLPRIVPDTAGSWSRPTTTTLRFDPIVPFVPGATFRLDIPGGMSSRNGGRLAKDVSLTYRVADGSILRLQQLLAELSYLPLTFTASTPELDGRRAQGVMAFDPPQGSFAMRFPSTPEPLANLWKPGQLTAMTTGAVMAFENVHKLDADGVPGPAVWSALLQDAADHVVDPQPYTWAWTTMSRPETLRIWSNGAFVFSSKANTGIAAAPTPKGSWPVFARFRSQTMQGTNPDGTKYKDPGVPYINYFYQGDAIHGFKRASYGSPQSLGCVELPYDAAAQVWSLIDYGTVVTVTS